MNILFGRPVQTHIKFKSYILFNYPYQFYFFITYLTSLTQSIITFILNFIHFIFFIILTSKSIIIILYYTYLFILLSKFQLNQSNSSVLFIHIYYPKRYTFYQTSISTYSYISHFKSNFSISIIDEF